MLERSHWHCLTGLPTVSSFSPSEPRGGGKFCDPTFAPVAVCCSAQVEKLLLRLHRPLSKPQEAPVGVSKVKRSWFQVKASTTSNNYLKGQM